MQILRNAIGLRKSSIKLFHHIFIRRSSTATTRNPYRILSINGGSVRGIMPLKFINYIEERSAEILLNNNDEKSKQKRSMLMTREDKKQILPISKCFDYIGGTSIGGIIALMLTKPDSNKKEQPAYTAQDALEFIKRNRRYIFWRFSFLENFPRLNMLISLLYRKLVSAYDRTSLDKQLKEIFGNTLMSSTLTETLVTTYDIYNKRHVHLTRQLCREGADFHIHKSGIFFHDDLPLYQAAIMTASASFFFEPYYFPFAEMKVIRGKTLGVYVDAGLWSNDPTFCILTDAMKYSSFEDMFVVSLGTGRVKPQDEDTKMITEDTLRNYLTYWNKMGVGTFIEENVSQVEQLSQKLLCIDSYHKLQPTMDRQIGFDETSDEAINKLMKTADDYIENNRLTLDNICETLINGFRPDRVPVLAGKLFFNKSLFSPKSLEEQPVVEEKQQIPQKTNTNLQTPKLKQ